jgi:hypothetical protein
MENDKLTYIESLMKLMDIHKIDCLSVDGIELKKSKHTSNTSAKLTTNEPALSYTEDDVMFYSARPINPEE